jgi:hypothetical protein
MNKITISAENYTRLHARALVAYPWLTGKRLPDGRYEIEVDDEVLERLRAISTDMDVAIELLLVKGAS